MMTVSDYSWLILIADEQWIMKMLVDDWMMIYDDEYSEWWLDTL